MNENNAMNLDDLRDAWARLDQRVDSSFARMEAVTNALATDRARTLARRAMWAPAVELLAEAAGWIACVLGLSQQGSPVFFACTIACLAFLTVLMVSAVWQLATLSKLDAARAVVATQRQLGRVRALRIFEWKWVLLLSPVLWAPFLVVAVELPLKLLFGTEATDIFSAGYVLANLLIGFALTGVLFWLSRRIAERFRDSSFLRNLLDDFAGRRLTAAREFLARLDGFERE